MIFTRNLVAAKNDVIVFSETRRKNGHEIKGRPGEKVTISYTVDTPDFRMMEINFNGSLNSIVLSPDKINGNRIRDKRLKFVENSKTGAWTGVRLTLWNVSMQDNGLRFSYTYVNRYLKKWKGFNTLKVTTREQDEGGMVGSVFNIVIYACVITLVVLVGVTTVVHLVKRGIICVTICRPTDNVDTRSPSSSSSTRKVLNSHVDVEAAMLASSSGECSTSALHH